MSARANAIIAAAEMYRILGLFCVPIEPGTKAPKIKEWNKLRIESAEFPKYWRNGQNAGVLLGIASRFLCDADLDDPHAVAIVNNGLIALPKTGWIFGRPSKQRSHYIYETAGEFSPKEYADDIDPEANRARGEKDSHVICELRGTKQQTVFPPSRHPSGEEIAWTADPRTCSPAKSNAAEIEGRLRRVAVAVLLARHYPARNKGHEVAHYFSGWLGHACGWNESDVAEIMYAAATAAGDPDARDRIRNVGSTYKRIAAGIDQIKQRSSLENLLGANGPAVCRKIATWLALKSAHRATAAARREPGEEPSGSFYGDAIPKAKSKSQPQPEMEAQLESLDMKPKEHLHFFWPGYLPIGVLIHAAGKSTEAKSPLWLDIAARLSAGADFPDGAKNTLGPRSVILLSSEDDPATTIRPRAELAGANLKKLFILKMTVEREGVKHEKTFSLADDLQKLLAAIKKLDDLALIIIDPVTNYLGTDRYGPKMNSEEKIRELLMPLVEAARAGNFSVVTIGHLNRRDKGTDPLARIMGAGAFGGVARVIYFHGADPEDADKFAHILVQHRPKSAPTLRYRTFAKPMEWDGESSDVVGVEWRGESSANAEDAVDAAGTSEKSQRAIAAKRLLEMIRTAPNGRVPAKEAQENLKQMGSDPDKLSWSRIMDAAKAKSQRFGSDKFYSVFLPASDEWLIK